MIRRERDKFLLWRALNPKEFAKALGRAGIERNWKFLAEASEALKPRKPRKRWPLHLQIQAAYEEIGQQVGVTSGVTSQMIKCLIDPEGKISAQQFRAACRKVGLWFPHGQVGRPKTRKKVVKKVSRN